MSELLQTRSWSLIQNAIHEMGDEMENTTAYM